MQRMLTMPDPTLLQALARVAPGTDLRVGLDRILQAKMGALVVMGDEPGVLAICSGGFLLDADYTPQRLSELAKMDGAIILAADASRIARANVHLLPDPAVSTSETGTRHRTAERVARSVGVPVVSVSEEMSVITVYIGPYRHSLDPIGRIADRATQTVQTLERYRRRFDAVTAQLSRHEVDDQVVAREVVLALQRAEMIRRLADEVRVLAVELGKEGRLVELQKDEVLAGMDRERCLLLRDYVPGDVWRDGGVSALAELDTDELLDLGAVAEAVGLASTASGDSLHNHLRPRGYRLLAKVPRLSEAVAEHVVGHFKALPELLSASVPSLTRVDGVGSVRARAIREGLSRVVEGFGSDRRGG